MLRLLLLLSALGSSAPAPTRALAADTQGAGLMLYSARHELDADVPGTLARVAALGVRDVEVYDLHGLTAEAFRAALDAAELRARSVMVAFEELEGDPVPLVAKARALGADFVTCAWIPHEGTFGESDMRRAVEVFSRAGEQLAARGLRFAYHPHGYELHPGGIGETLLDRMIRATRPGHVDFELDVYYATLAGADPVAYLERYPDRFVLLHLKDLDRDVVTGTHTGQTSPEHSVTLGTGRVDVAGVLEALPGTAVRHVFVEDESTGALDRQLPGSFAYLGRLQAREPAAGPGAASRQTAHGSAFADPAP